MFYGQVNPKGSCRARSVYLNTLLLGRLNPLSGYITSIVHILLPETDMCPSWISGRERMAEENILWSISTKECCRSGGGWTHNLLITSRTRIQLSHRSCKDLNTFLYIYHISQRAHSVKTTSIQRWFNVMTLNQRWIDVVSTLYVCWDAMFCFVFSVRINTNNV